MRLVITAKEYNKLKETISTISKEIKLIEDFDMPNIDDIDDMFVDIDMQYDYIFVHMGNDGITMDVDEEMVCDILRMVYEPSIITFIRWIANTISVFKGLIEKTLEPAVEYIAGRYLSDFTESLRNKKSDK